MPEEPQWKNYSETDVAGKLYGVEYEWVYGVPQVFSERNSGRTSLYNQPAACAVCYVASRSTVLMVPARTECPDGWTMEYGGYLMSEHGSDRGRSKYLCWDEAPERMNGTFNANQCVIYPVEVYCGSLPCEVYIDGRELTCIVCSK